VLPGADCDLVLATLEGVLERERHLPSLFATACVLQIPPGRRSLRMRRAGHLAPLLIHDGAVSPLPEAPGGRPLGLAEGHWPEAVVELPAGWSLLLYTDGLTEAQVGDHAMLGDDRLVALVAEHLPGSPLRGLVERVEDLHGGPLRDDVALLLVESRPGRPGAE
jgi:serine phosphatase RsbU (regulator of sigma subunit)